MIIAVLDTNTLASGIAGKDSPPAKIINAWKEDQFTLVTSTPILSELDHTLAKPYFKYRMGLKDRNDLFVLLIELAQRVELHPPIPAVATHPEDDLILATAAQAKATHLVTGDGPLQQLKEHAGARILSPRQFLQVLSRHPPTEGGRP